MKMLKDKIIICDSNISWDFNRYSKHHLMAQFAKRNRVVFVNPQVDAFEYLKQKGKNYFNRIKCEENLEVLDSIALPFRAKSELIRRLDRFYFSLQLRRFVRGVQLQDLMFFLGNPSKVFLLDIFKSRGIFIYHCSDNFSEYFKGGYKEKIAKWEKELISRADMVIAVSPMLQEKCKKLNPRSYLVEHGVDERFFSADKIAQEVPSDLKAIKSPRVGYIGCLDRKIDLELLVKLLSQHPDKSFVFIGTVHETFQNSLSFLKERANFYYLGAKTWWELPLYYQSMDIGFMPFVIDKWTSCCSSPLKLLEFIASGKIVVSTAMPISEKILPAVKIAFNQDEFSNLIDVAMSEAADPKHSQQRSNLARGRSWKDKAEEISELVEKCLIKK
ncbi:MAG: hypothetical protein ABIH50_05270 [bacterium]